MHLGVYPPNGRIRVAAPLKTSDEAIRLFVISRIPWIRRQRLRFTRQERQTKREYVSGESHYLFGKRYRLNVIHANVRPKIEIRKMTHIDMYTKLGATAQQRAAMLDRFYRSELRKRFSSLIERWPRKVGVMVNEVKIKKMKTRWGTCNPKDKRVWLNLELAKKSLHCIDYVFVHELVHLVENGHSERFIRILESVLPNWERQREELNEGPLGYSEWECVPLRGSRASAGSEKVDRWDRTRTNESEPNSYSWAA